ncbi:hypothetical protein GCM10020000_74190 [Streptomyces olivoverticillatus]
MEAAAGAEEEAGADGPADRDHVDVAGLEVLAVTRVTGVDVGDVSATPGFGSAAVRVRSLMYDFAFFGGGGRAGSYDGRWGGTQRRSPSDDGPGTRVRLATPVPGGWGGLVGGCIGRVRAALAPLRAEGRITRSRRYKPRRSRAAASRRLSDKSMR